MGKIRLKDLARIMKVPEQDLMFKLKSIGVRLEGVDPEIDSEIIQAIVQGKSLPQPREVILRRDNGDVEREQRRTRWTQKSIRLRNETSQEGRWRGGAVKGSTRGWRRGEAAIQPSVPRHVQLLPAVRVYFSPSFFVYPGRFA